MANNDCHLDGVKPAPAAANPDLALGCWDQLTQDAARLYPNDKLLQHAAAEEKMGPNNYSTADQKLMEAYREFIDIPPLQKLAVQEAENKYFHQGPALTEAEQARLDGVRTKRDDQAHESEVMARYAPFAAKEFPGNARLQELAAKELAQDSMGKILLSRGDYAELHGAREFQGDTDLQKLSAKEFLHQTDPSQPGLKPAELTTLTAARFAPEAERQFPGNEAMQKLAMKERLADIPGQPQLNEGEKLELDAARIFPGDSETQKLYIAKRTGDQPGNQKLSADDERRLAQAFAVRDFPDDKKLQDIEVQEQLWLSQVDGVQGLSRSDYVALHQARDAKMAKIISAF